MIDFPNWVIVTTCTFRSWTLIVDDPAGHGKVKMQMKVPAFVKLDNRSGRWVR